MAWCWSLSFITHPLVRCFGACAAFFLLVQAPDSARANLFYKVEKTVRLTDLNPSADGSVPMSVTGLNASGRMVGYFPSSDNHKSHAFVWDNATKTLTDLNTLLNADSSMATCVNASGQVAGIFWASDDIYTQTGFIYQVDGTVTTFLPPGGGLIGSVNAINDAGHVIGTCGEDIYSSKNLYG